MSYNFLEIDLLLLVLATAMVLCYRRVQTLYFGLSVVCLFHVSSVGISRYLHAIFFRLPMDWVTDSHLSAMRCSIWGCIAMLCGMATAWGPKRGDPSRWVRGFSVEILASRWINTPMAWFILTCGAAASIVYRFTWDIPTVGTAIYSLTQFTTIGLLLHLVLVITKGNHLSFIGACCVYMPVVLMGAFTSGHTPAKIGLLIPAACIIGGLKRVSLRTLFVFAACGVLFMAMMVGWMRTRDMIRTKRLEGLSFVEKVSTFIPAWFHASTIGLLSKETQHQTIAARLDMTDLLAMQVRFQPHVEPYAHGRTFLDAGIAIVPRALWPEKPSIAGGWRFVSKYTGADFSQSGSTSIGLPYQFEFYANWGFWGVVVGLYIVGYLCAWLERGLFASNPSLPSLLFRILCAMTISEGGQRADWYIPCLVAGGLTYFVLGLAVQCFLPAVAATLLGNSPRAKPAPAASGVRTVAVTPNRTSTPRLT